MEVVIESRWNPVFFQEVINFKKDMQGHIENYFPETLEDYEKFFNVSSPFLQDYEWTGFLLKKDRVTVAKAILCWKKDSSVGNLGYIDWINDVEVARRLSTEVEKFSKSKGLNELKSPVDMNFFVKYRIKCPGGGDPIFGEPIYPDYYHDLFKQVGYGVVGTWDTYRGNKLGMIKSFAKRRKQLSSRKHKNTDKLTVRSVNVGKWDEEIKIVFHLFNESFKGMPEFEPITFDQFKLVYDDFKYLIHPWYSYIVELNGNPVGFSINYPDPLPVLKKIKGKKLGPVQKALLFLKLRTNFKTLLMAYVGKIPGPNGEEIKGVQIKISKKLSLRGFFVGKALVCYQSSDSPSRRPMDAGTLTEYSNYVLYGKKI